MGVKGYVVSLGDRPGDPSSTDTFGDYTPITADVNSPGDPKESEVSMQYKHILVTQKIHRSKRFVNRCAIQTGRWAIANCCSADVPYQASTCARASDTAAGLPRSPPEDGAEWCAPWDPPMGAGPDADAMASAVGAGDGLQTGSVRYLPLAR